MEIREQLLNLKKLLEEERELLLSFPLKNINRFEEIQEEKRKLLLNISSFSKEEVEKEKNIVLEIYKLNSTVSALISNGLSFFEEIEKELFGENITYKGKNTSSLFNKKA